MQIFSSLDKLNIDSKNSAALGNFDGIHLGHRKIMEDAIEKAKEGGLKSLCFTFSNHPFNFILQRDDDDPAALKLICSEEEKIRLIEEMGFDILINIPFDETIMKMRANDFFSNILSDKLNAGYISVGFNYTYGARAEGKPEMLKKECEKAGMGISVHDAVMMDGKVISSTLIREYLKEGRMEDAGRMLGRPYAVSGRVMHGSRIGSAMGIPTINIPAPKKLLLPPSGVYFSRTIIDDEEYKSVSNIGFRPTVSKDEDGQTIETNIFGFDRDAYGSEVSICLDHFSRPERLFESKEALFEQIRNDCDNAKKYYE